MHVDDFIDRFTPLQKFQSDGAREAERYARFVLMLMRLPAALQCDFREYIPRLFCSVNDVRYRVVFASRMGWVGLTRDFDRETYERQEELSWCHSWGPKP